MDTRPIITPAARRRRRLVVVLLTLGIAGPLAAREIRTAPDPVKAVVRAALPFQRVPDPVMLERALASVRGASLALCELAAPTLEWDMGSWGAKQPLADDRFSNDDSAEIVAWIRSRHNDPALIDPLLQAISDRDPCVRRVAAPLLGRLQHPRALSAMLEALRDREADTRAAAAMALGFSESQRAISPLIDALGDGDRRVRRAAAWAIGKIEG